MLKNGKNRSNFKRQHYLLRNLLWIKVGKKQYKMYGSTPTGRYKSYSYYITHAKPQGSPIRIKSETIDQQILKWLTGIVIGEKALPEIQSIYQAEIKKITKEERADSLTQLKRRLSELKEEEARLARLMITGNLSEEAYQQLRYEWQEKVVNVQCKIEELELDLSRYLDDLQAALLLMTKLGDLFNRFDEKQKTNLLQILAKQIIINPQGEIVDYVLNSPFSCLHTLNSCKDGDNKEGGGSEIVRYGSPAPNEPLSIPVERFLSL